MTDNFQATEGSGKVFRAKDPGDSILRSVVHVDPTTTDGVETYRNIDTNKTGNNIKSSAGSVYGGEFFNGHATAFNYVKLYNNSGTPTSSNTPLRTYRIPPKGGIAFSKAIGIKFDTGIAVRATTGVADNDNIDPATNDVIVNIDYK